MTPPATPAPATPPPARFTVAERVRYHEAGPDGVMRPDAVLDLIQEVAGLHAATLGLSVPQLQERGLSWVMTRERVVIGRAPRAGEPLSVETWPAMRERQGVLRDVHVRSAEGEPLVGATSAWALLDLATRQLVGDLEPLLGGIVFAGRAEPGFARRVVPALRAAEREVTVLPRAMDRDLNGHVNHARLLALLLEAVPDRLEKWSLAEVDMLFRAEVPAPAPLGLASARPEPGIDDVTARLADGSEAVRARLVWRAAAGG